MVSLLRFAGERGRFPVLGAHPRVSLVATVLEKEGDTWIQTGQCVCNWSRQWPTWRSCWLSNSAACWKS